MMAPVLVTIGSHTVHLLNRTNPRKIEEFIDDYVSEDTFLPVIIAAYKRRYLAVNRCHRLMAMAELIQSGNFALSTTWLKDSKESKYVLIIDGDELAELDDKTREALDWLEAQCLNPIEPPPEWKLSRSAAKYRLFAAL